MNITHTSTQNQTSVYSIIIPQKDVEKRYADALTKLSAQAKVEGFRKGKAPKKLAEKSIGKEKIYDDLIQTLLPDAYKTILERDAIKPVVAPKVVLKKAKEGEDWELEMSFALQPVVHVPDYRKIAKDVRGEAKKEDIWVPGKGDGKSDDDATKKEVEKREKQLNQILEKILDQTRIELSDIIIEQEVQNRLARLVDDVRKIGLSIDDYFSSRKTDKEKVSEEFKKDVINTYKLEFALNEIGDKERITVEKEEIEKLIAELPDDETKKEARDNAYVYTMMLRKQKILDFLGSL